MISEKSSFDLMANGDKMILFPLKTVQISFVITVR